MTTQSIHVADQTSRVNTIVISVLTAAMLAIAGVLSFAQFAMI